LLVACGSRPQCSSSTGDASVNAALEVLEKIGEIFEKWGARMAQIIDLPELQQSE
jgi:hypothetical protein